MSRISSESHFQYKFKIIVLGESDVGKSTIIHRFIHPEAGFPGIKLPATVGLAEHHERLQVRGKWIHLHLVDTAGQERFHNAADLVPQMYRGVQGAIVVFDVGSLFTFHQTARWVNLVRGRLGPSMPVVLVGNKTDEATRQVSSRTAAEFAKNESLFYFETSAKSRVNIDEIFSALIELLMQNQDVELPNGKFEHEYGKSSTTKTVLNNTLPMGSSITHRRPTSPRPAVSPGGIILEPEPLSNNSNSKSQRQTSATKSTWPCSECSTI